VKVTTKIKMQAPLRDSGHWTQGRPATSTPWPLWSVISQNRYFKAIGHNPSQLTKLCDDPYRLIFIPDNKVIAVYDYQAGILAKFDTISEMVDPQLSPSDVGVFLEAKLSGLVIEQQFQTPEQARDPEMVSSELHQVKSRHPKYNSFIKGRKRVPLHPFAHFPKF
jgi:hypothetical protein